jgi:hypothetical protein
MKQIFIFLGFLCFAGFSQAGHLDGIPSAEQQRAPLPAVLKQVAPDLHFFYNDTSSNSAFLVADAGVLVVDTGQHPAEGRALLEQDVRDEAKLLADVQAGVKGALAKGMSKEEMVRSLTFRQYSTLRNYHLIHGFIEALHHLYTAGKPLVALP